MSGLRLKTKRLSKLTRLSTDLDLLFALTNAYLKDLKTEEKHPSSFSGKTTTFRRYEKLSVELIPLGDGVNPPAERINPDYKQQRSNPRRCESCGKLHDCIVEDMRTREKIEEISKCKDCLLFGTRIGKNEMD